MHLLITIMITLMITVMLVTVAVTTPILSRTSTVQKPSYPTTSGRIFDLRLKVRGARGLGFRDEGLGFRV